MSETDLPEYADEIQIVRIPFDTCTKCNRTLISGTGMLRDISSKQITGKLCPKCGRYYINDIPGLSNYLATNYYLHRYRTSNSDLWVYSKKEIIARETQWKHENRIKNTPGAVLLLILREKNGKEHVFLIVTSREHEDKAHNVLYFWSKPALVLMTYALHPIYKGKPFSVRGQACKITGVYKNQSNKPGIINTPQTIYLRKNGGYHDPGHPDFPLVLALLYSPFSKHYEGMTVTWDKDKSVCYVDSAKFREFINKNGNPGIQVGFYRNNGEYNNRWINLNDSSFLMDYGYNVSARDNLPDDLRHQMLTEIVDLKIATISDIVNHLDFCITSHSQHPGAVSCWKADKEFIVNYKQNPERFLIAKDVRR